MGCGEMADKTEKEKTGKTGAKRLADSKPRAKRAKPLATQESDDSSLIKKLTGLPGAMADSAFRFVAKTTDVPLRVGKALFLKPEQEEMMREAGRTLRDLREVAGLTRDELSESLNLKDHSLLEAVENGTATLSFELILRLAAVLARHDPVPVIMKFTRTYKPEIWEIIEGWGLGRWTLQFEREREFINIFRRHDAARELSDDGFAEVLKFTRTAFEMALHFAAKRENLIDREVGEGEDDQ